MATPRLIFEQQSFPSIELASVLPGVRASLLASPSGAFFVVEEGRSRATVHDWNLERGSFADDSPLALTMSGDCMVLRGVSRANII